MRLSSEARQAFAAIVGDEHVIEDEAVLEDAATATFATLGRLAAVLQPGNVSEVSRVLQCASDLRVTLHPTSGGKNWGLGSRVPVGAGAVLLDLGRLQRISDFDEEMATIGVEAGVSFAQLYRYLSERKSLLFANTTGSSPGSSVLVNALERGDGTGPHGDRFQHVCGLQVVLPTGDVLHTGFRRYGPGAVGALHRFGVGPALDGLFSQSNLGVVTQGTLWLLPLPRALAALRFRFRDPARLGGVIDAVRALRLEGTLRSVVGIWNDYRVLSVEGQYPWQRTDGRTPLSRAIASELAQAWGGARWFGLAAVYAASEAQCAANVARARELLAPLVDDLDVELRHGEPHSGAELFHEAEPAFQFLQGIPHEGSLKSVYWRKPAAPPPDPDPDRDRCGVLWACPTVPLRGQDVACAVEIAERRLTEHGFEPLLAMVAQTDRVAYLVPLIVYDRDVPGEDERARQCHDQLLEEMIRLGYLPHRLGLQSMAALPAATDDFDRVLTALKRLLDPADVLSPGRYDFRTPSR